MSRSGGFYSQAVRTSATLQNESAPLYPYRTRPRTRVNFIDAQQIQLCTQQLSNSNTFALSQQDTYVLRAHFFTWNISIFLRVSQCHI